MIEDLTAMTVAKVDGIAVGGGLELTLVCDFVVATDRSRWGMPEIDWEITPGWGGTNRLAWFAGRRKAKEWNLIGALFDARTAQRYNLMNRLTTPERLDAEVQGCTTGFTEEEAQRLRPHADVVRPSSTRKKTWLVSHPEHRDVDVRGAASGSGGKPKADMCPRCGIYEMSVTGICQGGGCDDDA